ncbi:hypothetical protein BV898_15368 [Hypsibius exemplaris]|uniref:G-protein coupled receptors family 1 profile domain-containing protein n=1 Tax=Hypsibius exemplaris TaxID=2072580 RepID=A0A9X6NAW2_HYPEX|nr:hypothetical protein BV898_15368 [Hypsibius exemplaris]
MCSVQSDKNATTFLAFLNVTYPKNATTDTNTSVPVWTFSAFFYLVISIIGVIGNGFILLLIICNRRHRTSPFNFYVLNLLSANFLSSLVLYPMSVYYERNYHHPKWYFGIPSLSVYLYFQNVLAMGMVNTHAIMAANRVWAIIFPVSYRTHHSRKFAMLTCLVMWTYVHIFDGGYMISAVIGLYYRLTLLKLSGCLSKPSPMVLAWAKTNNLVVFALPVLLVIVSFPVVMVVRIRRQRQRDRERAHQLVSNHNTSSTQASVFVVVQPAPVRRSSDKFIVLAVLTVSVAVFYVPQVVVYLLGDFAGLFGQNAMFYTCQTLIDPVLLTLAIEPLRLSVLRVLICCGTARIQASIQRLNTDLPLADLP